MPSKIRPVFNYGGGWAVGGQVRKQLEYYCSKYGILIKNPHPQPQTWKHLVKMYEDLIKSRPSSNQSLWIFRENRGLPKNKSRYKLLAEYFGVGKVIRKKGSRIYANAEQIRQLREALGDALPNVRQPRNTGGRVPATAQTGGLNNWRIDDLFVQANPVVAPRAPGVFDWNPNQRNEQF